ncbi:MULTISPECIES: hypothetical protein [unclassified Haloferax]|uniref:hypothetical protein n=1 Tax=unclassified Haloferax TaxID=2625095 RepID=UPI0002AFFD0F|nr:MULTISPECIES: hypothetical protein [unclassified Haloferax]ELZ58133.1 hypothetical protein C460_10123 [Haloferax sp. ATCC BAA-646]ELZ62917.1 hypothetical protein C459_11495 [Haloferax sp. ATCC BAA-645]ELZ63312.1 hypothetical protein C458_16189 [Haloferax sp. ATCC BAA-644]
MSLLGSTAENSGLSLRDAVLLVCSLFVFHLGRGWARGLVEGEYLIGIVGLLLSLAPVVWLSFVIRKAYF